MLIYPTFKMAPIQGLTGFGGGATGNLVSGGAVEKNINLQFPGKWGSDSQNSGYGSGNYEGASVSTYWANATKNGYYGNGVTNDFEESDFTRVGDGILKFTLPAATYKIFGRSGDGSGGNHWKGMAANATLTLSSDTDILLLVPNHGAGNYGGGGGLFLIAGTDYTSSSNTALFILGGGGGGYGQTNTFGQPGALSTSLSQSRRGPSSGAGGNYDGGGAWLNSYTTEYYGGTSNQSKRVMHFVDGGRGGFNSSCHYPGGFGGGGGGCPGAGGGLQGGYPGTDYHNGGTGYGGSGGGSYAGGGGGTSYYNSSYVSSVTTTDTGSVDSTVFTSENSMASGFFGIFTVI
tara:strand:+ start:601 stop:1638 length:1038 start_codon:yes stop_codon:yes gene_type:complete